MEVLAVVRTEGSLQIDMSFPAVLKQPVHRKDRERFTLENSTHLQKSYIF